MSSTAYPFGMVPVQNLAAGYNTQGFETFNILDGYTTAIYFGDVVKMASTGLIEKDTGTTTLTPYGVAVGFSYVEPTYKYWNNSQYWPASTTTGIATGFTRPSVKVVSDPNAVFMIQADGAIPQTALGANGDIVQTAGSSAIGKSRNALSSVTLDTVSTRPLRVVGLADLPGNEWGDAYTIVLVKFNNHQLTTLTGI
ncbi:MAG: hypothetical protein WC829_04480 [Hyphomicrobium sp.]|jgi:hypothetical protein